MGRPAALAADAPRFATRSSAQRKNSTDPKIPLVHLIRGVEDAADIIREGIERDDLAPGAAPALGAGGVCPAPGRVLEGGERGLAGGGVRGLVDALQRGRDHLPVRVGDEVEALPQRMDDTGLDGGVGKGGLDGVREALQPVDDGDEGCLPRPDMDRLVADQALVADLDPKGVKENKRIDRLQRPSLPGGDLLQHRIRHRADQVRRYVDAVEFAQMPDNLARAHGRARISS